MHKTSITVCTHNSETTIGDCLAAIRESSYKDCELLDVDDGS